MSIPMIPLFLKRLKNRYVTFRKFQKFDTCSPDALPIVQKAFELTKDFGEGDYYEFGVYKGYQLYYAYQQAQTMHCASMKFFGFDSFQGLPDISELDTGWKFSKGQYACSLERVKNNLEKNGVSFEKTFLIPGYFSDVLSSPSVLAPYMFGPARIVVVDCDLYSSTVDVLRFIQPYLRVGTIIMMDDWNCFDKDDSKGERRATNEFLQVHPSIRLKHLGDYGWHGAYFLVESV